jgi:hypothetical protein
MLARVESRRSWHCMPDRAAGAIQIVLAFTLALGALLPRGADAQDVFTISPGHEATFLAMTGGSDRLPGGCSLEGTSIDRVLARARYRCDAGTAEIVLRHPSTSDAARRTTSFAIEPSSDAPPALVDAIEARIRAQEAGFEWSVSSGAPREPEPLSAGAIGAGAAAAVLALAALAGGVWWWWRRRGAARA